MSRPACSVCGGVGQQKCQCTKPASVFCDTCYRSHTHQPAQGENRESGPPAVVVDTDERHWEYCAELLRWGLGEVYRARDQAEATFNAIIRKAYREKLRVVAEISREIEALTNEIESYLAGSSTNLKIDQVRMSTPPSDLQSRLQLVSTSLAAEEVETYLSCAFLYVVNRALFQPATVEETWTDLQLSYVPYFGRIMEHFMVEDGTRVNMPRQFHDLKECSVWISISEAQVLLTGEKNSLKAYTCDVLEHSYGQVQSSSYVHCLAGLGRYLQDVYAFGGKWKETAQRFCERYNLQTGTWYVLPCMQFPRSSFTPAREGRKFYLLGGEWTSTAEEFDCETQAFHTLQLELNKAGTCLSVAYDRDLIVLLNGDKYVWEKQTQSEGLSPLGSWGDGWLLVQVPAVRNGDSLYMVGGTKTEIALYSLNLATKQVKKW